MVRRRRRRSVDSRKHGKTRRRGSRRGAKVVAILFGLWTLGLLSIALVFKKLNQEEERVADAAAADPWVKTTDDQRLAQAHVGECDRALRGFLGEATTEGKAQYVLRATESVVKMRHHERMSSPFSYEGDLKILSYGVLHTPAGPAIETFWQAGPDQRLEAVFFEENGEWKLDWEEFVRFSEEPWSLFVAGNGPDEGEFRVFARRREHTTARGERSAFGVILAGSVPGQPALSVAATPEIAVAEQPEIFETLLDAFSEKAQGAGVLGSKLTANDPQDMIRVRVKVTRFQEPGGERGFRIEKLYATHWFDFTGRNLPATAESAPQ